MTERKGKIYFIPVVRGSWIPPEISASFRRGRAVHENTVITLDALNIIRWTWVHEPTRLTKEGLRDKNEWFLSGGDIALMLSFLL